MNNQPAKQNDKIWEIIRSFDVPVLSHRVLNENESKLISDIREGKNRKYKLFCWAMKGINSLNANYDKYCELVRRHEILRRRYLYKAVDTPMCITLEDEKNGFTIIDIRKESVDKQKECLANVASAESREVFDPEGSAPLKIRVFVLSDEKIVVLMKVYMQLGIPISPFDIRRYIFFNMKIDSNSDFVIDEEKIENENREIINKCQNYWRTVLKGIDTPLVIPFSYSSEETTAENASVYTIRKALDIKLFEKIREYENKKDLSHVQMFVYEFGRLFGEASDTKKILFAIKRPESFMSMMPCKVDLTLSDKDSYDDIYVQCDNFTRNSQCRFDETIAAAGIDAAKYFNVMLEFLEDADSEQKVAGILRSVNSGGSSEAAPKLEIGIIVSDEGITISYSYDSSVCSENAVEAIHDLLTKGILKRVGQEDKFSWKAYIEDYKSREEQIAKLTIAQKALHIKEASFLISNDPEDFINLSSAGRYGNYVTEDLVMQAGQISNSLGILVSGHIEERQTDLEGVLKTVSVYKAGYILGLESLAGMARCPFEYAAIDDVKILWLDSKALEEIIQKCPMSYKALINKAVSETHRIKRLWVLN